MKEQTLIAQEIRLVDEKGQVRLLLSAIGGLPTINMLGKDGAIRLTASLDGTGYGSIKIANPIATAPGAALELDDKGAHVKFDRPGGGSAYLFLNNAGESGVVFVDTNDKRRLNLLVKQNGQAEIQRFNEEQQPVP
jgi:hypothetical protein